MDRGNLVQLEFVTKLIGLIAACLTLVSAVLGFIQFMGGDRGRLTTVLLVVGAIGMVGIWLGCAYLAFKRTKPFIKGGKGVWQYPRWRPWALASLVIIPLLIAGGVAYQRYQQAQPPTKVIILVANFDGPEQQRYRVTETVLTRLSVALEPYKDVQLEALGRAITEAEGSAAARTEGEKRKAAIVIWGWYGATAEAVPLSVHFEVLRPPKYMPELGPEAKGQVRITAVTGLESFTLQTMLSAEMAYLSLFTVGMACYTAEDWDGAVARFGDALNQTAEPVPALNQSMVYFYRGGAYYRKGDYDRTIANLDQAIQLKPDDAAFYNNRGLAYYLKHNYDCAIADYDQAIKLQPKYVEAYGNRGLAYAGKGDLDRAIADYDQAIQLRPDDDASYNNRGLAYTDKGDYDRAISDYTEAIQHGTCSPCLPKAYANRGQVYAAKGEYDRAIADYTLAIQLEPDFAEAYNNRGVAYAKKDNYDWAIPEYDHAIKLQPDFAEAYYGRGVAYANEGNYDQAIADFDQAIKLKLKQGCDACT